VLGVLMIAGTVVANDDFKPGDQLPPFSKLISTDRTEWNSSRFDDAQVLIIAFTCNRCPYSVDYEDRLNLLHRKYVKSGGQVRLLVINSNAGRDESLERMAERVKREQFEFRYVKDADQSVARSVGAVYTPEFFVFDEERRLVYKGALDDATNADDAETHYVNDAVAAILAGTPVETTAAGARGCTIRFKRRRPRRTP